MATPLHLHLESFSKRPALFHIKPADWDAAAKRHRALAKKLTVSFGWDGDVLDTALKTADFMINSSPPKERLRERAPRLKWIQTTGAGIDGLLPLDWLPADVVLTNNTGARITFITATLSSGKFSQSNNCGEVAAGGSCTATVTYYPNATGSDTGTLTLTSTAPNSPHVVNLSGTPGSTTTSPPSSCKNNGKKQIVGRGC